MVNWKNYDTALDQLGRSFIVHITLGTHANSIPVRSEALVKVVHFTSGVYM